MPYPHNQIKNYLRYHGIDKKDAYCRVSGERLIFGHYGAGISTTNKPNLHSVTTRHFYNKQQMRGANGRVNKFNVPVDAMLVSARVNTLIHWYAGILGEKAGYERSKTQDEPEFVLQASIDVLRDVLVGIANDILTGKFDREEGRKILEDGYDQIEVFRSLEEFI